MTGPRGLTSDDYVRAALAYVDTHGAAELTARNLGEALGVDPTAVYRHFNSLNELANAVVDHAVDVVNRKAFAASIEALLDYCESRASGAVKPRTSRAPQQPTR